MSRYHRIRLRWLRRWLAWRIRRRGGRPVPRRLAPGLELLISDPDDFVQIQVLRHGRYEPHVVSCIEQFVQWPGSIFWDVGANIGHHVLFAAHCGARVHAFEPHRPNLRLIEANVRHNRLEESVAVHPVAAGAVEETRQLYLSREGTASSNSLIDGLAEVLGHEVGAAEVEVRRLDDLLLELGEGERPSLLKIDVEGFEAQVLDGATELLSAPCPPVVLIETADRLADRIGESAGSVLGRLYERGFHVERLRSDGVRVPVARDEVPSERADYLARRAAD